MKPFRRSLVAMVAFQLGGGALLSRYCFSHFGFGYGLGSFLIFSASSYLGIRLLFSEGMISLRRVAAVHILGVVSVLASIAVVVNAHSKGIGLWHHEKQMFDAFLVRLRTDSRYDQVEADYKGVRFFYLRGTVSSRRDLEDLENWVKRDTRSCFVEVSVEPVVAPENECALKSPRYSAGGNPAR